MKGLARRIVRTAAVAGGAAFVAVAAVAQAPLPAAAQQSVTAAGWLPWSGCWEAVDVLEFEESPDAYTCIRPMADGVGAEILMSVDPDEPGEVETIVADAQPRSLEREGCRGVEEARFSEDGGRILLRDEFTCPGGIERTSSGVFAMVTPFEWIDVRTVEAGGDQQTWTRRYRWISPAELEGTELEAWTSDEGMAVETARAAAARAPSVDDVIEASDQIHEEAVVAWIAEVGDPFDIDGDALVRMADAGVSGRVTDVMIALSYPDRFALEDDGTVDPLQDDRVYRNRPPRQVVTGYGFGIDRWNYGRPGWYYGGWYRYDPFYHPWGYSGLGWGYGYPYRPVVVNVRPRTEGGAIVNGRGYTRPGSGARPSGSSGGGRSSPAASPSRGGGDRSGGGSVSSGGGYSGGSSSSGGRTAVPRDND